MTHPSYRSNNLNFYFYYIYYIKKRKKNSKTKKNQLPDQNSVLLSPDEFPGTALDVSIQETQYGLIINSIAFVPVNNWHSIVIEQNRTRCIVCDLPVGKPTDHIKLRSHKRNLDNYRPLNKYDSVLTRRVSEANDIFKTYDNGWSSIR